MKHAARSELEFSGPWKRAFSHGPEPGAALPVILLPGFSNWSSSGGVLFKEKLGTRDRSCLDRAGYFQIGLLWGNVQLTSLYRMMPMLWRHIDAGFAAWVQLFSSSDSLHPFCARGGAALCPQSAHSRPMPAARNGLVKAFQVSGWLTDTFSG